MGELYESRPRDVIRFFNMLLNDLVTACTHAHARAHAHTQAAHARTPARMRAPGGRLEGLDRDAHTNTHTHTHTRRCRR